MTKQTTSKQAKAVDNRPVTILSRYFIRASGRVCYKVRNGEGKEYQCCLHSNGATSCTCAAGEQGTRCYHVKACQRRELQRGLSNFFAALNEFCQIENYLAEQEYRDMGHLVDAPKPSKRECPWQKQYERDPRRDEEASAYIRYEMAIGAV